MKNLFKTLFRISLKSNNFMRSNFLIIWKNWRRKLYLLLLIIIVASFLDLKHENYFWLLEKKKIAIWLVVGFLYINILCQRKHFIIKLVVVLCCDTYINLHSLFFCGRKSLLSLQLHITMRIRYKYAAFWTWSNTKDFIRIRWNLAKF